MMTPVTHSLAVGIPWLSRIVDRGEHPSEGTVFPAGRKSVQMFFKYRQVIESFRHRNRVSYGGNLAYLSRIDEEQRISP
jgi:hypothetical protein